MKNNRIKKLREKKKLTLKELSKKIGISFTTLSKYENGVVATGKIATWQKLADFFNVSVAYLQNTDAYFDKKENPTREEYFKYKEYLKKRGQGLNNDDDLTMDSYAQMELNMLDNAFNWGNTSLRALPERQIFKITSTFENIYVSLFKMTDGSNTDFYHEYLKLLETISDLSITLNIVEDNNASDAFKKQVGFDRNDLTEILKDINSNLVSKLNIATSFDPEKMKFWDIEQQKYTEKIPKSADLSQAEKWILNKKIEQQNKKASDASQR